MGTIADIIGVLIFVRAGMHKNEEEHESDLRISVKEAVHKKHGDGFMHYIGLDLVNTSERLMRIEGINISDKLGRTLRLHREVMVTSDFNIPIESTVHSAAFWNSKASEESTHVKLTVSVKERGETTYEKEIESVLVPPQQFPTGEIFIAF